MTAVGHPTSGNYRGRFAPSPTGDLHAGSLLAALGSWLLARVAGGQWHVRIEDLDPPREVAGATRRQLDALAGSGLHPDAPVARQSERGGVYQAAIDRLLDQDLAFACHCSRSDLAAAGGVHRQCVANRRRQTPSIRLRVAGNAVVTFDDAIRGRQVQHVGRSVGDVVLRRADGYWAYQLAVVVDDAACAITDVARGTDLLHSTGRQILLQRALGLPTPRYAHLPLALGTDGRKLSKSDAAHPVDPDNPLPALRRAWAALGQRPDAIAPATDPAALLAAACLAFEPGRIPRKPMPGHTALHNEAFTNRH